MEVAFGLAGSKLPRGTAGMNTMDTPIRDPPSMTHPNAEHRRADDPTA